VHISVFNLDFGQTTDVLPQDWIDEIKAQVYENVTQAWCASNPRHSLCLCARRGDEVIFNQMTASMGSNPVRCWYSPCTLARKNTTGDNQTLVPSSVLSGGTCKTAKCQIMNSVFVKAKANDVNVNLSHIQNNLVCDGGKKPALPPNHEKTERKTPDHVQTWTSWLQDDLKIQGHSIGISRGLAAVAVVVSVVAATFLLTGEGEDSVSESSADQV
jgi:hypothetical protein